MSPKKSNFGDRDDSDSDWVPLSGLRLVVGPAAPNVDLRRLMAVAALPGSRPPAALPNASADPRQRTYVREAGGGNGWE